MNQNKVRILLVGARSLLISGTRIPFRQLLKGLEERDDVEVVVVDTCGIRDAGLKMVPRFIRLVAKLIFSARNCDVISFHFVISGIPFAGPFVALAAILWRKPLISRQIGGMCYRDLPPVKAAICRWYINRSDIYMVETKKLVRLMESEGVKNLRWYPNSRPLPKNRPPPTLRSRCDGKFIFIGQLKIEKGVQFLVEAAESAGANIVVDVYGPWYNLPRDTFDGCKKVFYKGEVPPENVLSTIEQYDALVIPTFLADEGYSGVIIEAYQVGRPVIGTRWNALPEIIIDGETGLLVEPKNAVSLRDALVRLMESPELYQRVSRGALEFGGQFSAETRAEELVSLCRSLTAGK